MTGAVGFFAALGLDLPKQPRPVGKLPSLIFSDVLLIIGVGLVLLLILTASIYFGMKWRRNRRRHVSGGEKVYRGSVASPGEGESDSADRHEHNHDHDHDHDHDHGHDGDDAEDSEHGAQHGRRRYKYRVRRRTHRSRNPTLSETGGLPPVKTSEPGKSC